MTIESVNTFNYDNKIPACLSYYKAMNGFA